MSKKVTKVGIFSYNHAALVEFHHGAYQRLQISGSPENNMLMEKLDNLPVELFFDNTFDITSPHTLMDLFVGVRSSPENTDRTLDAASFKKRLGKLKTTDTSYNVVPCCKVEGRGEVKYQESYHLHKFVYAAIIWGLITLSEPAPIIPLMFTIKLSTKVRTVEELVIAIKSHDDPNDVVKVAQTTAMDLLVNHLDAYKNHKMIMNGTTCVKKFLPHGQISNPVQALTHPVVGPLFRAYLDNTRDNSYNFRNMDKAIEALLEEQVIDGIKAGHTQGPFAQGMMTSLIQSITDGVLTLEEAEGLLLVKMNNPNSISAEERRHLKNSARLIYKKPPVDWEAVSVNAAENHSELGRRFMAAAIRGIA